VDRLVFDSVAKTLSITNSEAGFFEANGENGESVRQKALKSLGPTLQFSQPLTLGEWLSTQSFSADSGCYLVPLSASAGAVFIQFASQTESKPGCVDITLESITTDPAQVNLLQTAALSHLVMRSGHEFLNHQNGIQMNARLIEIMNQNDSDTKLDIETALSRLLSDSNRSVTLFRALQKIERCREGKDQSEISISVMREILEVLHGSQGRHLVLELPDTQHLPADYLLCLCVFLSGLLSETEGAVRLSTSATELVVTWSESAHSNASVWDKYLSPNDADMARAALPTSFAAWGLMLQGRSEQGSRKAIEHRLHLALPSPQ